MEQAENVTSYEIYKFRSIFSQRIEIKTLSPSKQPRNFSCSQECLMSPKCVGCKGDRLSQEYKVKAIAPEASTPPPKSAKGGLKVVLNLD